MDLSIWGPIVSNWVVLIVVCFVAFRAYGHITKTIFQECIDEAIKKLDDKVKVLNALRNLR